MAHIIDSQFYKDGWGTEEMRQIFEDNTRYQRWLDIEAALARVQARLGIIPKEASIEITKKANYEIMSPERIKEDLKKSSHSLVPLLKELQRHCKGDTGEYIHYGPTTQDIEDTGAILEIKDACHIIENDLKEILSELASLAQEYKELPMAGRTHNQQGLPITLGLKFAIWLTEVKRHVERLEEMKKRLFTGLLHGGTGTMAAFGEQAFTIIDQVMEELDLQVPIVGWATARDNLAEFINLLGLIAATMGKIGNEIYQLSRTEIGELMEPFTKGMIGSSTMPHKRNPELSEILVALSRIVINNTSLGLTAMVMEHERESRAWRLDWHTIPENCILIARILKSIKTLLGGLEVNVERIGENLDCLKGLLFSEALMLYFGEKVGKQTAHHLLYEAAIEAREKGIPLKDVILSHEQLKERTSSEELDEIMDYEKHIGKSKELVERALESC